MSSTERSTDRRMVPFIWRSSRNRCSSMSIRPLSVGWVFTFQRENQSAFCSCPLQRMRWVIRSHSSSRMRRMSRLAATDRDFQGSIAHQRSFLCQLREGLFRWEEQTSTVWSRNFPTSPVSAFLLYRYFTTVLPRIQLKATRAKLSEDLAAVLNGRIWMRSLRVWKRWVGATAPDFSIAWHDGNRCFSDGFRENMSFWISGFVVSLLP